LRVSEQIPFALQVDVWGAAWDGDLAERTAMLAEKPDALVIPMWDHTEDYLRAGTLITDEGVTRLPYRYALPWLFDWLVRTSDGSSSASQDAP
jgi:hypothetical protein